jgi:hypothetical protein
MEIVERNSTGSFREERAKIAKSCCCCLTLQKGISLLIISDIISAVSALIVFGLLLFSWMVRSEDYFIMQGKQFTYWFFTSGLLNIMMLAKSYYGSWFLYFSSRYYEEKIIRVAEMRNAQV